MTKDNVFDAVIMVDGVGRRDVERIMPEIGKRLEARGLKSRSGGDCRVRHGLLPATCRLVGIIH
jgi:ribosomal silencing factor RsfS